MHHLRPVLALLALTLALVVPAAAQADDASFSALAKVGLVKLSTKEQTVKTALGKVSKKSDVPPAKQALGDARSFIKTFTKKLEGKNPSTDNGKRAKDLLIAALGGEDKAFAKIANALDALRSGQTTKGRALLKSAIAQEKKAEAHAETAGKLIAGLG